MKIRGPKTAKKIKNLAGKIGGADSASREVPQVLIDYPDLTGAANIVYKKDVCECDVFGSDETLAAIAADSTYKVLSNG